MITFTTFGPPYTSSSKEPNMCIRPVGQTMPTVVVESGWLEFRPQDLSLWLRGGAGTVHRVLLFKWSKLTGNRVKGVVEVYNLDQAGNENLMQTEAIFRDRLWRLQPDILRLPEGSYLGLRYLLAETQMILSTCRLSKLSCITAGQLSVGIVIQHRLFTGNS
jgi:hypothetical protein